MTNWGLIAQHHRTMMAPADRATTPPRSTQAADTSGPRGWGDSAAAGSHR